MKYLTWLEAIELWKKQLEGVPPRTLEYSDRKAVAKLQGKRPEGHCKFCTGKIPGRRTTWCDEECKKQYFIACNDEKVLPVAIFERDRGVCKLCGTNVDKFHKLVYTTTMDKVMDNLEKINYIFGTKLRKDSPVRDIVHSLFHHKDRRVWEIDHIIPVAKGGGICGLDNFQTLCLGCHRRKTAENGEH